MGLFSKKTPLQKLEKKHEQLLKEAFTLSKINRSEGDKKYAEADAVMKEIEKLSNN
ncbi:MAG: Lacal_2735 family protein [Lishizhenia sp.]